MSTPTESSELPTHYGQTTLSGHHVERPCIVGMPQFAQPTRPPKRSRPASMHWLPNRQVSYGNSLPNTPFGQSNIEDSGRLVAQAGPSKAPDSPKVQGNQDIAENVEAPTDYFRHSFRNQILEQGPKTAPMTFDARTGRRYALPPTANRSTQPGTNIDVSTIEENSRGHGVHNSASIRPTHTYSRTMSFYNARELKRTEEEARDGSTAPTRKTPMTRVGGETVPVDAENRDEDHSKKGNLNPTPSPVRKSTEHDGISVRLPWTKWMNSTAKNHFVATIGEFVGTTMFLFLAFAGTQVANSGTHESTDRSTTSSSSPALSPTVLLYISLSFSLSLMVNVWIFFRISGGLFNPAVS